MVPSHHTHTHYAYIGVVAIGMISEITASFVYVNVILVISVKSSKVINTCCSLFSISLLEFGSVVQLIPLNDLKQIQNINIPSSIEVSVPKFLQEVPHIRD